MLSFIRSRCCLLTILLWSLCSVLYAASDESFAAAGGYQVEVLDTEWLDDARSRKIPAKIYLPKANRSGTAGNNAAQVPVIIFSHGLGGSRDGYAYLGEHWASHGYASVHLQHLGSDDSVWKGRPNPLQAMKDAATDIRNAINRPQDVSFAISKLVELNGTGGPLKGRLDLAAIGAAGHSFGAYTVLAVAGQSVGPFSARDERIKAGVAMSAPIIDGGRTMSFDSVRIPLFHFTGTRDEIPMPGVGSAQERRIPFDRIRGAAQFLVIFTGADHMLFAGRRGPQEDAGMLRVLRAGTTAFWKAFLREDPEARTWLSETDAFKKQLGELGTFEAKLEVEQTASVIGPN